MIEGYTWEMFNSYEQELKAKLCWAIDTADLDLLDSAYKEAKGISKRQKSVKAGRPSFTETQKEVRNTARSYSCLALSNYLGLSYTYTWHSQFKGPQLPMPNCDPERAEALLKAITSGGFAPDILEHFETVLQKNKK